MEQSGELRPTSLRPETIPFASACRCHLKKLLNAWLLPPLPPSLCPLMFLHYFPPPLYCTIHGCGGWREEVKVARGSREASPQTGF